MKVKSSLIKLLLIASVVMAPVAIFAEEAAPPAATTNAVTAPAVAVEAPVAAAPTEAAAAEVPKTVDPVLNTGDTAWILTSAALVFFMIPGLAFFYGGMVRSKNVLSTMMHSFVAMGIVGVQWAVIGYSLAFGPDAFMGLIGEHQQGASERPDHLQGRRPGLHPVPERDHRAGRDP